MRVTAEVNFDKGLWLIAHDRIITVPIITSDGLPKDLTTEELEYIVTDSQGAGAVQILKKTRTAGTLVVSSDVGASNNLVSILTSRHDTWDTSLLQVIVPEKKYWHTLRTANEGNYIALFEGYCWITWTAARQ